MEAEKHMTVGFKRFYNLQLTDHVVTTFTNHNANNTHTTIEHISDLAEPEIEHTIEKKESRLLVTKDAAKVSRVIQGVDLKYPVLSQ